MARERAFSDEQIIAAAEELMAAGKNINGSSLRARVGAGRPSALIDAYDELMKNGLIQAKTEVAEVEQEMRHQELPPEISDMRAVVLGDVDAMITRINDLAHHTVEQRLNGAIKEANKRATDAAIRESESIEAQAKAFEQIEDALDQLADEKEKNEALNVELTRLKSALDVSLLETKSAEKSTAERDHRITALEKQLKQAEKARNEAETALAKADGRVEVITASLAAKTAEYETLKNENSALQVKFNKISVAEAELRTNNQHLTSQISNQQNRIDVLQAENTKQTARINEVEATNSQLIKEVADVKNSTQA